MSTTFLMPSVTSGALTDFDLQFAAFLCQRAERPSVALALAAALVSRATGEGNVCLDMRRLADRAVLDAVLIAPPFEEWRVALEASGVVGQPGEVAPLILDGGRLYLYRYWRYETEVAHALRGRAADHASPPAHAQIKAALDDWFAQGSEEMSVQRHAAGIAALKTLTVISGGPGTGKTTTVVRVLAMLIQLAQAAPLRIALAAPTGKAAARLQEALRMARANLSLPAFIDAKLPCEAFTLHRLLGFIPGRTRFRHDRENPLPLDVLVVDEASMIDLALMAKLLDALAPRCRLIILGDKDQLASVEAGAILGSLCARPDSPGEAQLIQPDTRAPGPITHAANSSLSDCVVFLRHSYRFKAGGAISALAAAAIAGDEAAALRVLRDEGGGALTWHANPSQAALVEALAERYVFLLRAARSGLEPAQAFALLRRYGVLCARRDGAFGASTLNDAIEAALRRRGLVPSTDDWYIGRPIMIRRNNYDLRLFNGDMGIALLDPQAGLAIFFPGPDGQPRRFSPVRIADCDSAFAMTVHQSQGSEFDEIALVLPDETSPVLTRELFYTAVTRAAHAVSLWGSVEAVCAALRKRVGRDCGLAERLWSL